MSRKKGYNAALADLDARYQTGYDDGYNDRLDTYRAHYIDVYPDGPLRWHQRAYVAGAADGRAAFAKLVERVLGAGSKETPQ